MTTRVPIRPYHIEKMVKEVADAGTDIMLICPQRSWDGYREGDKSFWGNVPEESIKGREHRIKQELRLYDMGCDYLAYSLASCRKHKVTPGVTVRMNDMHDKPWPDSHQHSKFYKDNPDLHLSLPAQAGWSAVALDYSDSKVRNHYLKLIEEIVRDYDLEILELDFLRFADYFPRIDIDKKFAIINNFLKSVKTLIKKHKPAVKLYIRVGATPAAAKELGFDLKSWSRMKLVDAVTAAMFLNTAWNIPVAEFNEILGDKIKFFACADVRADQRPGMPRRCLPLSDNIIRGFASGYLAEDVDGIYFFNYFCTREGKINKKPHFKTLNQIKNKTDLLNKPRLHLITSGHSQTETDLPMQLPVNILFKQSREFSILLAKAAKRSFKMTVTYTGELKENDLLWLSINSNPVGHAAKISKGDKSYVRNANGEYDKTKQFYSAEFSIPEKYIKDGENKFILRNEGIEIDVCGIEVSVM
jgi:hypothetical protein